MASLRTKAIQFRVSPEEKDEILARADERGVAVSEYLRAAALGQYPTAAASSEAEPEAGVSPDAGLGAADATSDSASGDGDGGQVTAPEPSAPTGDPDPPPDHAEKRDVPDFDEYVEKRIAQLVDRGWEVTSARSRARRDYRKRFGDPPKEEAPQ